MFFAIEETLRAVDREDLKGKQFVAVMSFEEWLKNKDTFEMVIDMDLDLKDIFLTKAEVNYDSLTGSFAIPDRKNPSGDDLKQFTRHFIATVLVGVGFIRIIVVLCEVSTRGVVSLKADTAQRKA